MKNTKLLLAHLALGLLSVGAVAQEPPSPKASIETGVLPLVQFTGEEQRHSIDDRRRAFNVHTLSMAVFRDGKFEWADAYGEEADADTLYQAGSLSKAVAAAGIIALAKQHGKSLDADISAELPGLDLARLNPDGVPITLRGLLSHTNGASIHGFPGYAVGEDLPTTRQVIEGDGPANTEAVVISAELEGKFQYSGGGYTIAQYWAEQLTGEPFPQIMQRLVLDPLGMKRSLFSATRPDHLPRTNVARAHGRDGAEVEGGWHLLPEHAAASLWSTPREYGMFLTAVLRALDGEQGTGLDPEVAREMATPVSPIYGAGIGLKKYGDALQYFHSGSNEGFKSYFVAIPDTNSVSVVMSDTESSVPLMVEIQRTAAVAYGWPGDLPVSRTRVAAPEELLIRLSGTYRTARSDGPAIAIAAAGNGELQVTFPNGRKFNMVRTGEWTWINPEDAREVTFAIADDGTVSVDAGQIFVKQ